MRKTKKEKVKKEQNNDALKKQIEEENIDYCFNQLKNENDRVSIQSLIKLVNQDFNFLLEDMTKNDNLLIHKMFKLNAKNDNSFYKEMFDIDSHHQQFKTLNTEDNKEQEEEDIEIQSILDKQKEYEEQTLTKKQFA